MDDLPAAMADRAGKIDKRFSDPEAEATPWAETVTTLERAELYWLTTVRRDGRPHVTPLIGVVVDEAVHFCTGPEEQKARNLEHNDRVAITTGNNAWARGLDVVVEGRAVQITDDEALQRLADAWEAKYGSVWHFDVDGDMFVSGDEGRAAVFRVEPAKVLAFAKEPHAQTAYRFPASTA
jgi:nitroimidazol reductase NimA-like FMN-containing flavoprotein (pyridoxamine 5'-phosphate oxidase superfamily)